MTIYTFNSLKFAKNDRDVVESLFSGSGTCHGFYKKTKNGIQLFRLNREPEAFIVLNQARRYIVSMGKIDGKNFYMQGSCSLTEKWLGIENASMAKTQELIDKSLQ